MAHVLFVKLMFLIDVIQGCINIENSFNSTFESFVKFLQFLISMVCEMFYQDFFQYTLEKIYTLGQRRVNSVTRENLRVEFADLTQIDVVSGKERKVLRRPLLDSIWYLTSKSQWV